MKKTIKVLVSLLLVILIAASISWYLLEYDPDFTRDLLLSQAHRLEEQGRNSAAVWLYNLAYHQADRDEDVAIELAQYYKSIGNYSKAEYTLTKAIEDGGGVKLYVALCKTFVEQDKLRDAVIMLDKVTHPEIKAQLDTLRPAAPAASYNSGHYSQYITVNFEASDSKIYAVINSDYPCVSTDLLASPITLTGGETTVRAVAINESGLVSPMAEYHYVVSNVVEEVHFADSAFESAVRELLNISAESPVYSDSLWEITTFQVPSSAVSCEDLKWLPNLQQLTISNCAFESLQLLENLTELHTLSITDSVVSTKDLLVIANLPKLKNLTLSGCYLSSISNLAQATELTYLDLSQNSIRDLSALADMGKLEYLDLSENAITRADAITDLTALRTLDLSYNSLITTEPLASLTGLEKLDVSANSLFTLDGIDALTELTWFAASQNNLIDVDVLASCTKLKTLIVSNNTILNLRVLENHLQLEYLDFSYNNLTSLPTFSADCQLVLINGGYNQLSSLDKLAVLEKLEYVYMDYNVSIQKIDKLANCPCLKVVNVYGSKVKNVSKLTDKGIQVNFTPT